MTRNRVPGPGAGVQAENSDRLSVTRETRETKETKETREAKQTR